MHAFVRRGLYGTLTAGGLMLLAAAAASADTTGNHSIAGGTQILAPVTAPASVHGNAVSVLGRSSTSSAAIGGAGQSPTTSRSAGATTSGTRGFASGMQVVSPVTVPVNLSGNAISVLGSSSTSKASTNATRTSGTDAGRTAASTSGDGGAGSGTQVVAPVSAPLNVGGNAISVLGTSSTTSSGAGPNGSGGSRAGVDPASTSGRHSVGSGTQALIPVNAPVAADGNAIAVLGRSSSDPAGPGSGSSTGSGGAASSSDSTAGATTSGDHGLASGTQILIPVYAPVSTGGNSVSLLGDARSGAGTDGANPSSSHPAQPNAPAGSGQTTQGHEYPGAGAGQDPTAPAHEPAPMGPFGLGGANGGQGWGAPVCADVMPTGASHAKAGAAVNGAHHQALGSASASAAGVGGRGSRGAAGPVPCTANIALMNAARQEPRTAGLGSPDFASTALSAALLLLLGASVGSAFRKKVRRPRA